MLRARTRVVAMHMHSTLDAYHRPRTVWINYAYERTTLLVVAITHMHTYSTSCTYAH